MLPFTGYGFSGSSDEVPNNSSRRLRSPRSRPDQFNVQPSQGSHYQTSQNQFDTQSSQQYHFQVNPSQFDTRSPQHFYHQDNSFEFNTVPSVQSYPQTNPALSNIIPQLQPLPFGSHPPLQQEPAIQPYNANYYQGLPNNLTYDSQNYSVTDPANAFAYSTDYQPHVSESFANNMYSSTGPFQSNSLSLQSPPNAQFYYDPTIHVSGSPSASNSLGIESFEPTHSTQVDYDKFKIISTIHSPDNPENIPTINCGPLDTLADHTLGHEFNRMLLQNGKFRIMGVSDIKPNYDQCFIKDGNFRIMGVSETKPNYDCFYYDRQYLDNNRYVVTKDKFTFSVIDKAVIVDEGLLRTNPRINVSYILEEHLLTHTIRNNPKTLVSSLKFTEQSTKDLVHSAIEPYSQKKHFSRMSGNVVERLTITKAMIVHLRKDIT